MCRGCGKDFCMSHANQHRQELGKQMDELTLDHDQFRQKLMEKQSIDTPYYSHLKQKIKQWEEESIGKIHQVANDARKNLENMIEQHSIQLTEALAKIAHEIDHARKEDEYFETDIQQWTQQLYQLKNNLAKSSVCNIRQEKNAVPFISKIYIDLLHDDAFGMTFGNVQLEDNNQVSVHDQSDSYATVRGKGEYLYGQHRLRLKIEEYHSSKWIFVGITSAEILITDNATNSPSIYGWVGPNQVYLNGVYNCGYGGYRSDAQKNDILELLIDCDEHKIRLTNERTNSSYELDVDLIKCPFPWQLNLILYFAGDRIRLLPS